MFLSQRLIFRDSCSNLLIKNNKTAAYRLYGAVKVEYLKYFLIERIK